MASTSPSSLANFEKKHWWLRTKKIVDKYVKDARTMVSTRDPGEIGSALGLLDAALALNPRSEPALELRARCLLYLRRFKDVADMLQDFIPSHKMQSDQDSSSGSGSSDNSLTQFNKERVKLLPDSNSKFLGCDYWSLKCFSVSDLKKKVLAGISKNTDKEGQWRYVVLGQACCHLGLMEDAMVLLQHGKRLASAAFRRESICWSDDSFSFCADLPPSSTASSCDDQYRPQLLPLTESESVSQLITHVKLLVRRRTAALAALDAGLYSESIRHFSKILDGRRPAPQAFLADCYIHRSAAYRAAGRIAESIADCNRTLALDPSHTGALLSRATLWELTGCITDAVHDLEHVKLLYNSILRDRKPPGPAWKPQIVRYREIPGRLCTLTTKIQQLKQRIANGETGNVDYYALIGLRRGCSRSEIERAHLLLNLKHKPEKSMGFIDKCEFVDERDFDSVKDRARMSSLLLYRLIQKGCSSILANVSAEEAAEVQRCKAALALQEKANLVQAQVQVQAQAQDQEEVKAQNGPIVPETKPDGPVESFQYQGVFCRDLAAVGNLLSQAGFNRPIAVKYEALSC